MLADWVVVKLLDGLFEYVFVELALVDGADRLGRVVELTQADTLTDPEAELETVFEGDDDANGLMLTDDVIGAVYDIYADILTDTEAELEIVFDCEIDTE